MGKRITPSKKKKVIYIILAEECNITARGDFFIGCVLMCRVYGQLFGALESCKWYERTNLRACLWPFQSIWDLRENTGNFGVQWESTGTHGGFLKLKLSPWKIWRHFWDLIFPSLPDNEGNVRNLLELKDSLLHAPCLLMNFAPVCTCFLAAGFPHQSCPALPSVQWQAGCRPLWI